MGPASLSLRSCHHVPPQVNGSCIPSDDTMPNDLHQDAMHDARSVNHARDTGEDKRKERSEEKRQCLDCAALSGLTIVRPQVFRCRDNIPQCEHGH